MSNYATIEELLLNIGYDLSNTDLSNVNLIRSDLRNVILPKDKKLFQKIKNKSLFGVKLPEGDYSEYDFTDVNLTATVFTINSILPKDKYLFKKIFRRELFNTQLPEINLNDYDFEGVSIAGTIFSRNSVFSDDKDFFQKIHNKNIYRTVLPIHDYSYYDFNDVCVVATDFQEQSQFKNDYNIFQEVRDKSFIGTILPKALIDKIQYYDLSDVDIDLNLYKLNFDTLLLLKHYQPQLVKNIKSSCIVKRRGSKEFIIKNKKSNY